MANLPKPQNLKKLQGTYTKARDTGTEAAVPNSKPTCPSWLPKEAKAEWRRIANALHDAGLLKGIDRAALAAYCNAWARWKQAELLVQEGGLLSETSNGNVIQAPAVGVANVAMRDMLKILKEFGMTPSSRSRLVYDGDTTSPGQTLAEQLFNIVNGE